MSNATRFSLAVALVLAAALAVSCASVPPRMILEPGSYEDAFVIIRYRVDAEGYLISVYNKTASDIALDVGRSSVISWAGESRSLQLVAGDSRIPPRSKVIYRSSQATLFDTDVAGEPAAPRSPSAPEPAAGLRSLREAVGTELRLYLPILTLDGPRTYDLRLKVVGVGVGDRVLR